MIELLGKKAPRVDPRTLKLASYLKSTLGPPPESVNWTEKASNPPMFLNDTYGDCTCAAFGHLIQSWTASNGAEVVLPDSAILKAYADVTGFTVGDPSTDNGAFMLDVLQYARKVGIGGRKIAAYVVLEPRSREHVKQAIHLFGGCYIGLALPVSAQNQNDWAVALGGIKGDPTPGSWGGHAVAAHGYDDKGVLISTWGRRQWMTWAFWNAICDESYAVLSPDWADADGAPSGFAMDQLRADLGQVVG